MTPYGSEKDLEVGRQAPLGNGVGRGLPQVVKRARAVSLWDIRVRATSTALPRPGASMWVNVIPR